MTNTELNDFIKSHLQDSFKRNKVIGIHSETTAIQNKLLIEPEENRPVISRELLGERVELIANEIIDEIISQDDL